MKCLHLDSDAFRKMERTGKTILSILKDEKRVAINKEIGLNSKHPHVELSYPNRKKVENENKKQIQADFSALPCFFSVLILTSAG